ncbi:MerR family transcriptional regulator [Nannocystis pusilla]|uniref:MerR family transcriptional regulator n=1 Tax=Nannocystis pusilla TaxID=889268 RepID=UPI003DA59D0E
MSTGRYRIQSVAEMTGVSAATLRAWERRYGLPAPRRSSSAYRLYSDRDVRADPPRP